MRFLLKILVAPVIAILAVLIWICGLALKLSAWVFGIISTILSILGVAILILDNMTNGIIVLIIAFIVSPLDVYKRQMVGTFEPPYYLRRNIEVNYSPFSAEWNITGKSLPSYSDVNAYMTYGTERALSLIHIFLISIKTTSELQKCRWRTITV